MNVYLDNSATTKPSAAVAAAVGELMESGWYNPSALYKPALEIQKRIDGVRETCLQAAGAAGQRVIFTSGGTEADNLALLGHLKSRRAPGKVLISSVEHPAVSACAEEIRHMGFETEAIPAGKDGRIDPAVLEQMLDEKTVLISVMQVNNETGAAEPLAEITKIRDRKAPGAAIHVDGVQGFLRMGLDFNRLGIQSYAFSGHKIHGLKGTGALIARKDHAIRPIQYGGGQEGNLRSGTENTFGILALGEAVSSWDPEANDRMRRLKNRLRNGILERIPTAAVNGPEESPETCARMRQPETEDFPGAQGHGRQYGASGLFTAVQPVPDDCGGRDRLRRGAGRSALGDAEEVYEKMKTGKERAGFFHAPASLGRSK